MRLLGYALVGVTLLASSAEARYRAYQPAQPRQAGVITCTDRTCSGVLTPPTQVAHRAPARAAHYRGAITPRLASKSAPAVVSRPLNGLRRAAGIAGTAIRRVFGGGAYVSVCAGGHCGTVAADVAGQFKGLFEDFAAMGYNLGGIGCLSSGHMRFSLHHSGHACDLFNQYARDRMSLPHPSPQVMNEVAAKHGLTSGCEWGNRDCGHFDTSGYHGGAVAHYRVNRYYTRAQRTRHVRYARRF